ncbi:ATP-binding cassette sub-family C member 4-like [Centruroides vittatus]|uniref:ATP-binding cassette sub-family C member 4-like n=1 Tax=Centruroides vittatus TaxID=120091 RepID=UPI00350EA71C
MKPTTNGRQKTNPYDSAGVFSRLFFCWLFPLLIKGKKRWLQEDDLYETSRYHSSEYLGNILQKEWDKELMKKNPNLRNALLRFIGWKYLLLSLLPIIQETILTPIQAYLLGLLVNYFDHRSRENDLTGYLSATGFCVLSMMFSFTGLSHFIISEVLGMKIKVALSTVIYRKAIRLSNSSLAKSNIGQMVTLLANDITKFYYNLFSMAYVIANPLIVIVTVAVLWQYFEWTILPGISVVFVYVTIQFLLGKLYSKLRLKTVKMGDERLNLLNEMIAGMRLIKMSTWEKPYASLVENTRKKEVRNVKASLYVRGISFALAYSSSKLFSCLTFLTFFFTGGQLTAQMVFVNMILSVCIFRSIFSTFSMAVTQFAEIFISLKRLQEFLLLREKDNGAITIEIEKQRLTSNGIWMKNITAAWNKNGDPTLKGISLNVKPGELLAVVGSVGSGKTSLLMSILREIPISSGELSVKGKIAYASQEAWLFYGTIRENILFGETFHEEKYRKILHITALEKDIKLFSKKDLTRVGEKGVIMSGGQKARINLARALYLDADIYILDDPLSAVDIPVASHIFEKCIMEYLSEKICILVTHHIHFLKFVNKILVLKEGNCEAIGDYNKIINSEINLGISAKDESSMENEKEVSSKTFDDKELSICSVEKAAAVDDAEKENERISKELKEKSFGLSSYKAYVNAGAGFFFKMMIILMLVVSQAVLQGSDFWLSKWIKDETDYQENSTGRNFSDSKAEDILEIRQRNVYVYCALILASFVFTVISVSLFYEMSIVASINLHKNMLRCIIRVPISFLDTNPIGKILNRFSKDIMSVDEMLSFVFQDVTRKSVNLLSMIVIQAIISPYLLIFSSFISVVFYFIWTIHNRVLKSLKHLEGKSRSPVFSHLSSSLYGITTIRAFKVENNFKNVFNNCQDKHTATWFLYVALNGWIAVWGHLICFVNLVIIVVILNVVLTSDNAGSMVGLALTYATLILMSYPWLIRQASELDYQMNSVSRILNYSKLKSEAAYESPPEKQLPAEWPDKGEIDFDDVSLQYTKDKNTVLNNLTFHVNPGEKIGIVGRTGAGKSSLTACLFRMTEPTGKITIDGIVTKDIGLRDLRSKISIIPQDPVLFTGPLRRNIDPFNEYSEKMLWQVMEDVQLKEVIGKLPGGLDTNLTEGGRNFSVGQKQLICLSRAVLRKNKILVMDEASSNIDNVTDSLIQKIIREKFLTCTVLTVAHRPNTVIDSDRIMVLDTGRIQEFDHPYVLLKNTNGAFYNLVKNTGRMGMKELYRIAKSNYFKRNSSRTEL